MEFISENYVGFSISTNKSKLDIPLIHKYLSEESYWAKNIPLELIYQSIENSLNFGIYYENIQIGYARIISDYTTFAYLCDVFILSDYQGKGLSQWLLNTINQHPNLQNLRRWMLMTLDAQEVYKKNGWQIAQHPERVMEKYVPNIYQNRSK